MPQQDTKVQLTLSWGKCSGNVWCGFNDVDLAHNVFSSGGVYVIWSQAETVYVGQAEELRERLADHRKDARIQQFRSLNLKVTWAEVASSQRDSVERYLSDVLNPLVGERTPTATPIVVNLPS